MSCLERRGEGGPVLLLHGVGGNAGAWARQFEALGTHHLIAWDAPGYGDSENLRESSPRPEDYAAACLALLDALDVPQATLLGHSFGGLVAACVAAQYPQRVSRLLLTACSSGHATYESARRDRLLRERIEAFASNAPAQVAAYARARVRNLLSADVPAEVFEEAVQVMSQLRREGFHQANRMISAADIFRYLPAIAASTRVLCGTADRVTPIELNEKIAAAIAGADLVRIEHAGHWLFLEHAHEFNSAVNDFIERRD